MKIGQTFEGPNHPDHCFNTDTWEGYLDVGKHVFLLHISGAQILDVFSKGIENPTSGIGMGHFTGTKTGANVIKRRTARFQTGRLRGHGPEISGGFSGRS